MEDHIQQEREILPKNVKPVHYELRFEPHLEKGIDFDGEVIIHLDVLEDTSSITLNATALEIFDTELTTEDGNKIETSELGFDKEKERVTIVLKQTVAASSKIKLKQTFKGSLLHHASGFFRSPIKRADGSTEWMASTHLQPIDARRTFPCFDEPALKATFTVTLIADRDLTCLGNMDVDSEVDTLSPGKEKKVVTFHKTPLMSTYLVCFAVGNLNMIESDSFRVPVRLFAAQGKNIEHGQNGLELAVRALKVFEKTFDIDFPLPKMDLIAVPGGQGAMENWGLVTFEEIYLLVDEHESSATAFRRAQSILVHELAHQWFGNLVTMDFWEGLWLNEGFADWAELHAWETLAPDWKMWQAYTCADYQDGLLLDSNKASHPVEVPIKRAGDIMQIFDAISYCKGSAVIRTISGFLGIDVFLEGVRKYLKKHAHGNTTTNDLWDALSEASGKNVGQIMDILTRNVGYPVVSVTEDESSISVTQHRFLQDGNMDPEDDTVLYPLSLALQTENGIDEELKLYSRTRSIEGPLEFYKINAGQNGFYRVSYGAKRLQTLGRNARDGLLSPEDRIGIVSDALAMASSGISTGTEDLLSLLEGFDEEPSFFVWKQILGATNSIIQTWAFEKEAVTKSLEFFQTHLVQKCLRRKGWHFGQDDDTLEQMFKTLIFAHSGDDPQVLKAATGMFEEFIGGDQHAINVNIQEAVFAIVLKHGGQKEVSAYPKDPKMQLTSTV